MKKLKSKKIAIVAPLLLLVVAGAAYKLVLAPKPAEAKKKVDGTLVALSDPFTLNLAGGHYGRISVSLLLNQPPAAAAVGAAAAATTLPENDVIRSVITDELTGIDPARLIDRGARHDLLVDLLNQLKKSTDEPVTKVMFTDIAVQ